MIKQKLVVFLFALLTLACAVCGCAAGAPSSSEEGESQATPALLAGQTTQGGQQAQGPAEGSGAESPGKRNLYDPSIFVIEAAGSWRQELAPGYWADYECKLYVDKFDANDNRSASGVYTGVFWMKTTVDAAEYIKEMLKDLPMAMDFAAGGEGVCDNLTMQLLDGYERNPFGGYAIPDGQGGGADPPKEALAGEGGLTVVGKQAYLNVSARGAGGASLSHQDSQTGDAELSYIVQVEPDTAHTAAERKVTIHLSDGKGMSATIEGRWRRLPGYRDDMLKYANEGKAGQLLERWLQ